MEESEPAEIFRTYRMSILACGTEMTYTKKEIEVLKAFGDYEGRRQEAESGDGDKERFTMKERDIFRKIVEDCPVIAAVKDMEGLEKCLSSDIQAVFVLFGNICNIVDIVNRIKEAGRMAVVHIDLVAGLSSREISVDFIKENTRADGIISTRQPLITRAKELGLLAVQRFFVIDSMALESVLRHREYAARPDFIEILPGTMPKIFRRVCAEIQTPVIAGGLISDKEDIMAALGAGACAISTTNPQVWFM